MLPYPCRMHPIRESGAAARRLGHSRAPCRSTGPVYRHELCGVDKDRRTRTSLCRHPNKTPAVALLISKRPGSQSHASPPSPSRTIHSLRGEVASPDHPRRHRGLMSAPQEQKNRHAGHADPTLEQRTEPLGRASAAMCSGSHSVEVALHDPNGPSLCVNSGDTACEMSGEAEDPGAASCQTATRILD